MINFIYFSSSHRLRNSQRLPLKRKAPLPLKISPALSNLFLNSNHHNLFPYHFRAKKLCHLIRKKVLTFHHLQRNFRWMVKRRQSSQLLRRFPSLEHPRRDYPTLTLCRVRFGTDTWWQTSGNLKNRFKTWSKKEGPWKQRTKNWREFRKSKQSHCVMHDLYE